MKPSQCTPPPRELSKETKNTIQSIPIQWISMVQTKQNKTNKQPSFIDRLEWLRPLPQVLPRPQLIFPSKTWFLGIYLNFRQQKSLKNQYLPQSESKSYQINSIKSYSSRSFQQHPRHIPIPPKFSATRTFALQVQTP